MFNHFFNLLGLYVYFSIPLPVDNCYYVNYTSTFQRIKKKKKSKCKRSNNHKAFVKSRLWHHNEVKDLKYLPRSLWTQIILSLEKKIIIISFRHCTGKGMGLLLAPASCCSSALAKKAFLMLAIVCFRASPYKNWVNSFITSKFVARQIQIKYFENFFIKYSSFCNNIQFHDTMTLK